MSNVEQDSTSAEGSPHQLPSSPYPHDLPSAPPDATQQPLVREARKHSQEEQAAKAHAAQRIQSCWREYRDAVAHLEQLTVDEDGVPVLMFSDQDDEEMIDHEEMGGDDFTPTAPLPSHPYSNRRSRAASQASTSSSPSLGSSASDLHSIIQSILTTAGDLDDEFASRNDIIREYAATIIQRNVRRSLLVVPTQAESIVLPEDETARAAAARTTNSSRHDTGGDALNSGGLREGGGDAELPDAALQALRILQNRFRFQRFRRMIEEREQNELIRRLQQLWRRRKNLKRHFEALRSGRQDAAARDIQRAYLRHREQRQQQQQQQPEPQLSRALFNDRGCASAAHLPAAVTTQQEVPHSVAHPQHLPVESCNVPQCIICMHHVVQIAFLPCGHAHTCVPCAAQCLRCPTCRRMVALQIRIYL
jgi:hypothetical protein